MPPKPTFGKDEVVRAAFELVKEIGIRHLTARKVAERLRSSTAPVYSYFSSMRALKRKVLTRAKDLLLEYAARPYTNRVFLNMGTGVVLFARDQCELYRALFMEKPLFKDILEDLERSLREQMNRDEHMAPLPDRFKDQLLNDLSIFTHGLASLMCAGLIQDTGQEQIIETLRSASSVMIDSVIEKGKDLDLTEP
jgi:AcrR family transcriptional regulator